jgi:hypothetical protein
MLQIYDDERPIKALHFQEGESYRVERGGITKIEAYREAGEMCNVPWFAVWKGDAIAYRVNGKYVVTVEY